MYAQTKLDEIMAGDSNAKENNWSSINWTEFKSKSY
jgi:hypothetical protein